MGTADRVIRILIAAVVISLYFANVINGTIAIVLLAISGIFILTSFISFCPFTFLSESIQKINRIK